MRITKARREKNAKILEALEQAYPNARSGLDFGNAFELLVATILSAQCTDKQVNKITPALFERFKSAIDIAEASPEELEPYVKSCGFYRNKSKNIYAACKIIAEQYNNTVPEDIEKLRQLPGVGRKTANVVAANAFGADAIAVDTHVFRVSNRLGLAKANNVLKTEYQLMEAIPKEKWRDAHHYLIWHGRLVCNARKPKCDICTLGQWCDYYKKQNKGKAK